MKKLVHFALAALFFLGVASAQNLPPVDVFGGYSYLNFQVPNSGESLAQRLKLNGWDVSASAGRFHHFSAEADISGHWLKNCGGNSSLKCTNFSYMFGPRFTLGDRSNKFTGFVHGLVGQDRADIISLNGGGSTVSDTSLSVAAGGGVDYWLFRHVGIQLGPADYIFARHLSSFGAANQRNFRVSGGIAFRFGGEFPPSEPKPPKEPKVKEPKEESESHRSWKRPWHKTKSAPSKEKSESHRSWKRPWHKTKTAPSETQPENQPSTPVTSAPQPIQPLTPAPIRGMAIHSLGVVVAPQEFDGAKILQIETGSVAELASLKAGDLIKSVDGKTVRTPMELAAELVDKTGKVRIGILRGTFATETVILLGAH